MPGFPRAHGGGGGGACDCDDCLEYGSTPNFGSLYGQDQPGMRRGGGSSIDAAYGESMFADPRSRADPGTLRGSGRDNPFDGYLEYLRQRESELEDELDGMSRSGERRRGQGRFAGMSGFGEEPDGFDPRGFSGFGQSRGQQLAGMGRRDGPSGREFAQRGGAEEGFSGYRGGRRGAISGPSGMRFPGYLDGLDDDDSNLDYRGGRRGAISGPSGMRFPGYLDGLDDEANLDFRGGRRGAISGPSGMRNPGFLDGFDEDDDLDDTSGFEESQRDRFERLWAGRSGGRRQGGGR